MLSIYNTLSKRKEIFSPKVPGQVGMYVCGMTVYDYCHLGHARVMLVFDMVQRWLRASGYRLTYVRNITDVDDKIITRAQKNGEPISALTDRFIHAMDEDCEALSVQKPDHEPRATQFIPQMLELIRSLKENGLAYQAADGDVNFSVRRFARYGRLSRKSLDDLQVGVRVLPGMSKLDPMDFVLWKSAKPGEPVQWDSPYGPGRPGWHIECSAMATSLLGHEIDLHGGGADLMFPHHENEIAQSEGAFSCQFVRCWMHNGFVRVDDEKMSKSLGNFSTIRDILCRFDPEVLRFFILRKHYRSPLNYSIDNLEDARNALMRLYRALPSDKSSTLSAASIDWSNRYAQRFRAAMDDDFNSALAISVLFELAAELRQSPDLGLSGLLCALGGTLGLLSRPAGLIQQNGLFGTRFSEGLSDAVTRVKLEVSSGDGQADFSTESPKDRVGNEEQPNLDPDWVVSRIEARRKAKQQGDYAEADRIRSELARFSIVLEDTPGGTTWRRGVSG